jgi:hypothetical protein
VTHIEPQVVNEMPPTAHDIVVIGTLGKNAYIDGLVRDKKLNVDGVAGRWETWVTQVVDAPWPGVDRALVIAGSDKRGTIFGVYDLSSQIGVSPWYWFADVPAKQRSNLFLLPGRHSQGEPAVKYRGVFLNDEAPALTGWASEKFGGLNDQFYEHAFELILRLKGNYLWPAMWGNAFSDDDKLDPVLADEYGIVMGTSHHEPMLRAQQEWKRYGKGERNYEHNDTTLRQFWTRGIRAMDSHENIVTVGMRGDGDMPMAPESNIALLERIVSDQRKIIADVTKKDPSATPQLWALYKEVQDYYDKGMRVLDDVTLLFADDNWGNVRRLPIGNDKTHIGYTYWQEPPHNAMPRVDVIQIPRKAEMGVAIVEQNRPASQGRGRGGPPPHGATFMGRGASAPTLPTFDPYQRQTFHLDVYNKGQLPFAFTAHAAEAWVMVSPTSGTVTKEQRLSVSVDWTRVPVGERNVPITITGPNNARTIVRTLVMNPATPKRDAVVGFVEGNGYVSMEAEHFTRAVTSSGIQWQRIPDLGRTLSSMQAEPVTALVQTPHGDGPRLEYEVFMFDSGTVKVDAYVSPTLNLSGSKDGLRYAVSFDDGAPQIVNVQADTTLRAWENLVAGNISITTTSHTLAHAGEHTLKLWTVDPGVVLQKIVIETHDIAQSYLSPSESYYRQAPR